jgi:hypothetical protein
MVSAVACPHVGQVIVAASSGVLTFKTILAYAGPAMTGGGYSFWYNGPLDEVGVFVSA